MPPGFVVPLFLGSAQSNSVYVQEIGEDDRIKSFEPIETGDTRIMRHDINIVRRLGDLALWAFQTDPDTLLVAEREPLRSLLAPLERQFPPLVRLQAASLFGSPAVAAHIATVNDVLARMAPGSADLWRDLVILLPRIRQAAYDNLKRADGRLRASIDAIDLTSRGINVQIGVPANLIKSAGGEIEFAGWLSPLKPIFTALGIERLSIQERSAVAPTESGAEAVPASGLTIVHCLRDAASRPARKLRDVRHLLHTDLVTPAGALAPASLPGSREIVFLLVEDDPELVGAATEIVKAASTRSSMTGTLIVPRIDEKGLEKRRRQMGSEQRFSALAGHCHWIAFAGEVLEYDYDDLEPADSNPHLDRHTIEVGRWTPHALRACLNAGDAGLAALRALTTATSRFRSLSITSMASRGRDAAAVAARDALNATKRTKHPAISAQLIVLIAFHNRPLGAETHDEIEHAARACNPGAKVVVVEERREDMLKRIRVVAFTTGYQRVVREGYTPPARFLPLVRAGWKVGQPPFPARPSVHAITYARHSYILRFEPELVVTSNDVDEIIRSTQMHHGEVALLVAGIRDEPAVERLLCAGIFCAKIGMPRSFDRFGNAPGAAIRSAHAQLSRPQICERLSHFAGHYVLAGLWQLGNDWQLDGQGIHTQWAVGAYHREPVFEQFELHRMARDGTWFFRGVIRLDPAAPEVARLRYAFGIALDDQGVRRTRIRPVDGEYDIRADVRRRLDERYAPTYGRKRPWSNGPAGATTAQFDLPGLSGSPDQVLKPPQKG